MNRKLLTFFLVVSMWILGGCATESHRIIETQKVASYKTTNNGKSIKLAVGKFNNKSSYMNGVFSDGVDKIGNQSKSILITHLQQTNRFIVFERENLAEIAAEANFANKKQEIQGAQYIVTGDVSEFGRKQVGDRQLFGILGSGKSQIAYAKINLNIIDTTTSEVIYTTQGSGEYALTNREIVGFGGTANYDSTLNGKVLDLAMREAINSMVNDIDNNVWKL